MFHRFTSTDDGVQCFRCGGYWSTEREDEAGMCVAEETDFNTVHGSDYENQGHDLDCAELRENLENGNPESYCKHMNHDCNCDICEFN